MAKEISNSSKKDDPKTNNKNENDKKNKENVIKEKEPEIYEPWKGNLINFFILY